MKGRVGFLGLILLGAGSAGAVGATPSQDPISASLSVDRGRIYQDLEKEKAPERESSQMELSASTWAPSKNGLSSYDRASMPKMSLRWVNPFAHDEFVAWSWKAGLGFLSLEKSQMREVNVGVSAMDESRVDWFEAPLGVEARSLALSAGRFSPFVTANLIPALAFASSSLNDRGSAETGFTGEMGLGTKFRLMGTPLRAWDLVIGGAYRARIWGDLNGSGWDAQAGIRAAL